MSRVALIIPNNLWVCPYVSSYTSLFNQMHIDYDIISWNRSGIKELALQYDRFEKSRSPLSVLMGFFGYTRFIKKNLKKKKIDKVIVFSSQLAIFLVGFLKKKYKKRYILDYRDLSIEQNKLFMYFFKKVLVNSYTNIISSPGFKQYLPIGFEYIVVHNFNINQNDLDKIPQPHSPNQQEVDVLTIGAIRTDRNIEVIDALGNKEGIKLSFVGKGIAAKSLQEYAENNCYKNISFVGFYEKKDEPNFIQSSSMINIIYPLIPTHISALSNRFYNSLIYKRPMIVTKNTIQGDFAENYHVGLVIENCDNLSEDIKVYLNHLDFDKYCDDCNKLLKLFIAENETFHKVIKVFVG